MKNKGSVQVHFTLGVLLGTEKQFRAAQLELEQANALQPQTFEILFNLGQVNLRAGDSRRRSGLESRVEIETGFRGNMYLLGQVYSEESKPVDALDLLVKAHKLAPENVDIHIPAGAREHVPELLRGHDSAAGIGIEDRAAADGPAGGAGRMLFHRRKGGQGD